MEQWVKLSRKKEFLLDRQTDKLSIVYLVRNLISYDQRSPFCFDAFAIEPVLIFHGSFHQTSLFRSLESKFFVQSRTIQYFFSLWYSSEEYKRKDRSRANQERKRRDRKNDRSVRTYVHTLASIVLEGFELWARRISDGGGRVVKGSFPSPNSEVR